MVFHITFMLDLFHDKNFCNCINLFSCIFVGFICNGFSIKLVKIAQDSEVRNLLASERLAKGHIRSACWKLKSQVSCCILRVIL